jgi:hypothetical protein
MLQSYAVGPNNNKLPIIDMKPEGLPNMPKWREGDPPLPPQHLVVDYHDGINLIEGDPERYRLDTEYVDHYAALRVDGVLDRPA